VTSENKDALLLFLEYIGQDSAQPDWAVAAPRITNTATYDDPGVIAMDKKLTATTDSQERRASVCRRSAYPFHAQVHEATAPIFFKILTGDLSPDERLDQIAAKAEEDLENLDYRS
jgi:multiple sugar transport system substrate-binding protein